MTFVPEVSPMSYRDAETHSIARLRRHFPERLTSPGRVDVLETLELLQDDYGADLSITTLPDGIEGRTWPDNRVEISESTYVGACSHELRPRFTIIHECEHVWHHAKQIRSVLESGSALMLNRRSNIPTFRDPEWQANALAAAYLMPLPAIRLLQEKQTLTPNLLRHVFGVSHSAATIRLDVLRRNHML